MDNPVPLSLLELPLGFPVRQGHAPLQRIPFWGVTTGPFIFNARTKWKGTESTGGSRGMPEPPRPLGSPNTGPFVVVSKPPDPMDVSALKFGPNVRFATILEYLQLWLLTKVQNGDLVGEMSLAPGEQVEFEVRRVERRLLEQSREHVTQFESSTESSSVDREAMATTATAAQQNQWNHSNQHGWNVGVQYEGFTAGASDTTSDQQGGSISNSVVATAERLHEATTKASKKLTTSTKIAVRALSETVSENRQRRKIVNPRPDAVLHVFAHEIIKSFRTCTFLARARPALVLLADNISFDSEFVGANRAFLEAALVDTEFPASLAGAVQAAAKNLDRTQTSPDATNRLDALEVIYAQNIMKRARSDGPVDIPLSDEKFGEQGQ